MHRYRFVCALVIVLGFVLGCGPTAPSGGGDDDQGGGVDASTGGDNNYDAATCAQSSVMATEYQRPVDIIWVIDNSGSMDAEEARVQNNMNGFASSIASSGVDYHVIVLTDTTHVNVPPPLGGSPEYLGVNLFINSNDALEKLVGNYSAYQSFLRPGSIKHIVAVTDDESDWSKAQFEGSLAGLTNPGFGNDWRFHAVVAEAPPFDFSSHCFTLAAAVGAQYIQLQQAHMGQFFSLCSTNWSPLFTTLAQSVSQGLSLPCTFDIPKVPDGQTLDPNKVNFVYTPTNGTPTTIANVGSAANCSGPGWYYDNPAMPTRIITCPATCSTLEGDPGGKVTVEYGCATVIL
jgi:hypothetical protein